MTERETFGPRNGLLLQFVHVPKTGGASLNRLLRALYGSAYVRHDPPISDLAAVDNPRDVKVVSSHEPRRYVKSLMPSRVLLPVAVVRDPVERAVSLYNFTTTFEKHPWFGRVRSLEPHEFFDSFLPGRGQRTDLFEPADFSEFQNHQCIIIDGDAPTAAEATAAIREEFLAVCTIERHTELVELLSELFGWPPIDTTRRTNVSTKALAVGDLDAELRARIKEWNSEDRGLYDFVFARPSLMVNSIDQLRRRLRPPI